MSNLSPGLNARFASIELDTSGSQASASTKVSRKQYPANLYPQNHAPYANTTPSKGPRLSTAARAQSRSSSSTKAPCLTQVSQKRNLHSALSREDRGRGASRHEDKHTKYQDTPELSFMKETSSSRKKQSSGGTRDRSLSQTRSSSHSDIYTRRSHHYASLASKKRQVSKSSTAPDPKEAVPECTVKVPFADKPTIFTSYSPSRNVSTGHTPRSSDDVYTRLYQGSRASTRPVDKPNKASSSLSTKPISALLPKPPSALTAKHSVASPTKSHVASPIKSKNTRIHTPTNSASTPTSAEKPSSIEQMYHLIYKCDPGFFIESNSLDVSLAAQDPIPAADLISSHQTRNLSVYERGEIMRNPNLYYVPTSWKEYNPSSDINISSYKNNYGFDDSEGNYLIRPQDHIEYRYEIVRVLGTGSFGNVVHCTDHKYLGRGGQRRNVAIKLIKNELDWSLQAVSEIKMLKHLMAASQGRVNDYIMNYCDHFHFRGHMCIVSEMLSLNFYTFLEIGNFRGVCLDLVKNFAFKILKGLQFVHDQKVIHCDLKPENIMIRLPSNYRPGESNVEGFDVKLIDFGSSCFETETSFSYIQSRFYRAPEVILGARYGYEIDIWSFGCVIAELFTGSPLLPGKNELEQIALILEIFGAPPSSLILAERKRLLRFMKMDAHRKLNDPLVSDPAMYASKPRIQVDEKKLKKTLLYSLFNLEGKINLHFLHLQLQAIEAKEQHASTSTPFKKTVKIGSRSLDVAMRLHSSNEEKGDQANFSKFMNSIFQWNPVSRPKASQLLESPFLQESSLR
ncbi:hypothetical protein JCM33374_g5526 [Metschnikowia sp. JCM 33374]|nr:hypothetical protein JCM33374_g5526 [Metschnikowia sp. JCM 33374]